MSKHAKNPVVRPSDYTPELEAYLEASRAYKERGDIGLPCYMDDDAHELDGLWYAMSPADREAARKILDQ